MAGWRVFLAAAWVAGAGAAACGGPPAPSAELGRELYGQNGCASCHGRDGHGDGPVAPTLDRRPRDLHDAGAFTQGTDVRSIAATIATGVVGAVAAPGSPGHEPHDAQVMPKFEHLSEGERRSLALYVIGLRTPAGEKGSQP